MMFKNGLFDCNQFNRNKKDALKGVKKRFDNLSFNCFWYKLNLDIVADHYKPWLKDYVDIEMNNEHISISKKNTIKYDKILLN